VLTVKQGQQLSRPHKSIAMPKYLVCYDYGAGGVWLYVEAESPSEITATYRDLKVFETPPSWMTPEAERSIRGAVGPFWDNWLEQFRREKAPPRDSKGATKGLSGASTALLKNK
jgi:hypothetical protein